MIHLDDDRIWQWIDGELSQSDVLECQEHVAQCETCRSKAQVYRATLSDLRTLPKLRAPLDFWETLEPRLRPKFVWMIPFGALGKVGAMAFMMLFAGVGVLVFMLANGGMQKKAEVSEAPVLDSVVMSSGNEVTTLSIAPEPSNAPAMEPEKKAVRSEEKVEVETQDRIAKESEKSTPRINPPSPYLEAPEEAAPPPASAQTQPSAPAVIAGSVGRASAAKREEARDEAQEPSAILSESMAPPPPPLAGYEDSLRTWGFVQVKSTSGHKLYTKRLSETVWKTRMAPWVNAHALSVRVRPWQADSVRVEIELP